MNYIDKNVLYSKEMVTIGYFNTISGKVIIEDGVSIGNGCTIEGDITIGKGTTIGNNVTIINCVTIGKNNQIFSGISIGYDAQHRASTPPHNRSIVIGDNNIIRENVTIHLPYSSSLTTIKDRCFIMVNCNIPHDAIIHSDVTIAYNVAIGGGCEIFDYANIGLNATLHQGVKIGQSAMIGMGTEIAKDVLPFATIYNKTKKIIKINNIGIARNLTNSITQEEIESFYKYIQQYNQFPLNISKEFKKILEPFKESNLYE